MSKLNFIEATKKWKLLVAADIVVFSFINKELNVLLVQRKFEPGIGKWALPGGFVRENENIEHAALRELREETGLKEDGYLEQLYTFGEVDRDPRARVISVAYLVLVNEPEKIKIKASDDASEAAWFSVKKLPELAFGKSHRTILLYAVQRLRWKFEYTNVATSMLSNDFTLSNLQNLYENVYNKKIDKRNFRKKILSLDFVEPVDRVRQEFGRPAQLYKAKSKKLTMYSRVF